MESSFEPSQKPAPRKLSSQRRWSTGSILLTVLIVIGVAVGGYFLFKYSTAPNTPTGVLKANGTPASRRFIFIGSGNGHKFGQFTDEEFRYMASHYDMVFITKFHANFNRTLQHEAARRLKELNPNIKVFAYINTKFWHNPNDTNWNSTNTKCANAATCINPDWLLKDLQGKVIPYTQNRYDPESEEIGNHVDESNPDYRAWIISVAQDWLKRAPYDGIYFDSADPIGDYGAKDIDKWRGALCQPGELKGGTPATDCAKVKAYNEGINDLLATATKTVKKPDGTPAIIFYNGFHPSDLKAPDRNLSQLQFASGALDEFFCETHAGVPNDVLPDIKVMQEHADKLLILRVPKASLPGIDLAQTQRYCLGSFLMGWQPGSSFYREGTYDRGGGIAALEPPDVDIALGNPRGAFTQKGELLSRTFDNGLVYVNHSTTAPISVTVPAGLTHMQDGEVGETYAAQATLTLGPTDSAFFLNKVSVLDKSSIAPTSSTGNKNPGKAVKERKKNKNPTPTP